MSKLKNTGVIFGSDTDEEETVEQQKPVTQINDVTDSLSQSNDDWNNNGEVTLNLGSELLSRVSSMEDCINPLRFFNVYTILTDGYHEARYDDDNFKGVGFPSIESEPTNFEGPFVESSDDKFIVNYHENKIAFFGRPQSAYTKMVYDWESSNTSNMKMWWGYKVKYEPPPNSVWSNKKLKFKVQLKQAGNGGMVDSDTGSIINGGIGCWFDHYRGTILIEEKVVKFGHDHLSDGEYGTLESSLTSETKTIQPNDYFLIYVGEGGNGVSTYGNYGLPSEYVIAEGGLGTRSYDPPVVKFTGESGEGPNGGAGGGTYSPYIFDIEQQKSEINFDSIGKPGQSVTYGSGGGGGGCGCVAIEFVGYWGE